jgi:Helix-turn-helix domain
MLLKFNFFSSLPMLRPPALNRHQREDALQALDQGTATQADLARRYNVSQSTISRLAP